jgi:hypothetical protein
MFGSVISVLNRIFNRLSSATSMSNFVDSDNSDSSEESEEMEEESVMQPIDTSSPKGIVNSIKRNTKAFFESYKGVRRISVFFLLFVNAALVYISSLEFLKIGKIDPNWVSIVEIYSSMMTIVICYYFHLRAKDIKTAKGTIINNVLDPPSNSVPPQQDVNNEQEKASEDSDEAEITDNTNKN